MTKEQLTALGFDVRRYETEEERRGCDRTGWGDGPWQNEPVDRVEWRSGQSPLPRLVLRGPHGSWCGYVGLPPGHPLHGKKFGVPEIEDLDVHGGVTFGDECGGHICHVPGPGEAEHVWWIGFDCNHAGDVAPGMDALLRRFGSDFDGIRYGTYRRLEYAVTETERLAAQLEQVVSTQP